MLFAHICRATYTFLGSLLFEGGVQLPTVLLGGYYLRVLINDGAI